MKRRRSFALAASVALFAALASPAGAQESYPSRPVRFVVPFPPSGASDLMARIVAKELSEKWGKAVVVDNRTGGNGILGTQVVANSPPDGYTWLLVTFFHVTNPSLYPSIPYDTVRDFSGVATIARSRYLLIARSDLPANTAKELIALAKARPGELTYGSAGVGGGVHLAGAYFNKMVGTKMLHVPYKGAAAMLRDQMGGRIDIAFHTTAVGIPALGGNRVKALAITGESRFPSLPQVPTFAEAGLPEYQIQGWFGLAVPSRTPRPIVDKISADVASVLPSPGVKDPLTKQAMEPFASSPAQVDALIKTDIARYAQLIKEENIKPE